MTQIARNPQGGRIDRTRPLGFTFNGQAFQGYAGDTLASALLANGVRLVGRSFKYHRPRGILAAGVDEPNAIVDVLDGDIRQPNLRATEVELHEGLTAVPVNAWPSLAFDLGAINNLFTRFIATGFYYKTFILPHWHAYEWAIRRVAGLGRLSASAASPRYDHHYAHCDVLIVGSGPSGLAAALAAGQSGESVLLAEQDTELGGSLLWTNPGGIEVTAAVLRQMPNLRILTRTTATGFYDHNELMLVERLKSGQRLWQVRAKRVVLATGALERPLLFPGNDLPGIMLASAAQEYATRYAVRVGERILVVTNNDSAYAAARCLGNIAAIIDTRPEIDRDERKFWERKGVNLQLGAKIVATAGRRAIAQAIILKADGRELAIACDLIAMSGGWNPTVHLFAQSGGRLRFDDRLSSFVPDKSVQSVTCIGACDGELEAAASSGWALPKGRQKAFVDFQNDVTTADIAQSARENYVSVEHLKRYTTLGMATDQGKTSNVNAIGIMGALTGRVPAAVGSTRYRPPFSPVAVGVYAGRRRGQLYCPCRYTPMHEWHLAHGAVIEDFGEWQRPAYYPGAGETRHQAEQREALAVRTSAGLFDNSPLGKIEVTGPEAAQFLDFIYANMMSTLKPGHLRYGLMLNEQGVIIDDGVAGRLAEDRFWVGTTSGGAARVASMLDEWLQCEFPGYRVLVTPVTANWSVPTLTGPGARNILQQLGTSIDLSASAFPHMSFRDGEIAGIPARVFRVSFTGELSYEIYVPADRGLELWQQLAAAGAVPVGIDAWMLLRTEKGYLHVGSDSDGTTTPDDIGWGHIHKRKTDFVGRRSLLRPANRREDRWQLVGLEATDRHFTPQVGDHFRSARAPTEGYVTSSGFSPSLGRGVAMGMLRGGSKRMGDEFQLASGKGRVRVVDRVAYDPKGERLDG